VNTAAVIVNENRLKLVTISRYREGILLHFHWEIDKAAPRSQENSLHSEILIN